MAGIKLRDGAVYYPTRGERVDDEGVRSMVHDEAALRAAGIIRSQPPRDEDHPTDGECDANTCTWCGQDVCHCECHSVPMDDPQGVESLCRRAGSGFHIVQPWRDDGRYRVRKRHSVLPAVVDPKPWVSHQSPDQISSHGRPTWENRSSILGTKDHNGFYPTIRG